MYITLDTGLNASIISNLECTDWSKSDYLQSPGNSGPDRVEPDDRLHRSEYWPL